jgi:outer membrane protein assembly factor BamB
MKTLLSRSLVVLLVVLLSFTSLAILNVKATEDHLIWETDLKKNLADFTITNHQVITLKDTGDLILLRKNDGNIQATVGLGGYNLFSMGRLIRVDNGNIFVGTSGPLIYCISEVGYEKWKHYGPVSSSIGSKTTPDLVEVVNRKAYLARDGFSCLDSETGDLLWERDNPFQDRLHGPYLIKKDAIFSYYIQFEPLGFDDPCWIDPENGEIIKRYTGYNWQDKPVFVNERLYFYDHVNKFVTCLDPISGISDWTFSINSTVFPIAIENELMVFGALDGNYYSLNPVNGSLNWKQKIANNQKLEYNQNSKPIIRSDKVFVTNNDTVIALNLNDGNHLWSTQIAPNIESLKIGKNQLAVTNQTKLAFLDIDTGGVRWEKQYQWWVHYPLYEKDIVYVSADQRISAYNITSINLAPIIYPTPTSSIDPEPFRFSSPNLIIAGTITLLIGLGVLAYYKKNKMKT